MPGFENFRDFGIPNILDSQESTIAGIPWIPEIESGIPKTLWIPGLPEFWDFMSFSHQFSFLFPLLFSSQTGTYMNFLLPQSSGALAAQ